MEQFDVYCERIDFSFWSEPVNALTNLAFVVAAVALAQATPRAGRTDWPVTILIGLILLVGIGSFLFHTTATRWAANADIIPITAFIYFFFYVAMRRLFDLDLVWAIAATILFFAAATLATPLIRSVVGYSGGYVPPLIGLVLCGVILLARGRPGAMHFLGASAIFTLSLIFRAMDSPVCESFALGTHFLWHLLNAVVLYVLVRAVMVGPKQIN